MHEALQEEFPVDWEDDHFVTRREFFKLVTVASGTLALGTTAMAIYSAIPKGKRSFEPAKICKVAAIGPGAFLAFSYPRPSDLCILVRTASGKLTAFSRRCTHLSCPVVYEPETRGEVLYCPCHNGAFSLEDGRVLQGPPPHPLPNILIEVRGDEVYAVGVASVEA